MHLEIEQTIKDGQPLLILSGEIDAYTVRELKETFNIVMKNRNQEVIIDMENVTYMDSTGLGAFIGALKSAKENNSELRLVNIQERVYRLFHITGLDEIMDVRAAIRGGNI